ncbi:hypothetical protein AGDE_14621 [Angomonas deanei]|uniref:Uncharacterized protein n=1 Tax=Angomonas deanei TaxID=59799 RepID=A0A7G2CRH0_9TRYP|nr:hypothetical protein AGDE_14621 [Angomonas deanei]CAD2222418.1 hypothetical protein, conserved [Angomonas deanei]|eukprot:EPY20528.1 hypothetical protein AGDE_14621 [Angomonas deanei]
MEQTGEGEDGSTTSPVPETPVDKDPNPPPADQFLVDVAERLKLIKSKSGKLSHSATLSKSMLTNSTRKVSTYAKKMKRVASLVESVALALKMELPSNTTADHTTDGEKEEGAVTESNVVDILKLVEKRISGDAPLQEKSEVASELDRMREVERRCVADAAAFKEALRVILMRLAESGKYTKSTLYLFGTDLQAEDDLLQEILDPARKVEDEDEEYVEKSLAALVQKYGRWAKRLHETTDDHLYAQQKIVKYITAVGRFFAPPGGDSKPLPKVVDVSLIDIDACLMKFADIILPALEAAIRNVDKKETGASNEGERVSSSSKITSEGESARSKEALAELAKHSDALPYDHRLASLHEMVTRLNTIVMSLLQVRYTAIPSSTRVRSSGSVELIFEEEVPNANFIDLDLDKLIKVSSTASEKFSRDGESGEGRSVAAKDRTQENNDLLLKVTSKNLESLIRSIKSFSSNHKLSAILLQKDIDGLQQLMAGMLEKFSELDIESLTGQNREELKELYTVFTDRAQQRGCYFFNRPGGEGDCMWVNGLKQLSTAFLTVMDKYAQRGEVVSRYRELIDDCMDLCAMYMNWTERVTLPADHAVPKELEECCVRDGEIPSEASRKKALQEQGGAAAGPSPTTPQR